MKTAILAPLLAGTLLAGTAFGQVETKLTASDGAANHRYGSSVDLEGPVAAIGASDADFKGAAYVVREVAGVWTEEQKLTAGDGVNFDGFGRSIGLSGNVIVVGASFHNSSAGAAYVYRFGGVSWSEEQKLVAPDAAMDDEFGVSSAVDGDVIVVGSLADDDGGSRSGSANVFRYNGAVWVHEQKLTASDAAADDEFGANVDIDGNVIVVGALGNDDAGSLTGSAYVFRFNGLSWIEEQKLTASDASTQDIFGVEVAIDGDAIAVGASRVDDIGGVYVFRFNGVSWVEEQKLTSADGDLGDEFGSGVEIDGDNIVVGTQQDKDVAFFAGSAYLFSFDGLTWSEDVKLVASDGAFFDFFGADVAISGGVALIGAALHNSEQGAAYIYEPEDDMTPPECEIVSLDQGPPMVLTIRVQDAESGVDVIVVQKLVNAVALIPGYTSGTNDPLLVTATKDDAAKRSVIELEIFDMAGNVTICDPIIKTVSVEIPAAFGLSQNYPNPFNPTTTIPFDLAETAYVELAVFDMLGRRVETLVSTKMEAGSYAVEWESGALPTGNYVYRLKAGEFVQSRSLTVLR